MLKFAIACLSLALITVGAAASSGQNWNEAQISGGARQQDDSPYAELRVALPVLINNGQLGHLRVLRSTGEQGERDPWFDAPVVAPRARPLYYLTRILGASYQAPTPVPTTPPPVDEGEYIEYTDGVNEGSTDDIAKGPSSDALYEDVEPFDDAE